jgi:ribosomal-protein-alanine N-acetyltransferase
MGNPNGRWPVVLREGDLTLRPLRYRDSAMWREVRSRNVEWLAPWEATHPDASTQPPTFRQMVRLFNQEARAGRMMPFVVELDGRLVGQVSVSGIAWGSLRSGQIGYWVDQAIAGRGIVPTAVAMAVDHCFFSVGLHRVEVNIRPENRASLRVVHKLGFRPEGVRLRYLHIDGRWCDHVSYAMTRDEAAGGILRRWRQVRQDLATEWEGGEQGADLHASSSRSVPVNNPRSSL